MQNSKLTKVAAITVEKTSTIRNFIFSPFAATAGWKMMLLL